MNHSTDAAEQIVRMSLEGTEVVAKITGSAAKEIAVFLFAALKSRGTKLKSQGKTRMSSMEKSCQKLEIFSIKNSDLEKFVHGAKQYGIVYAVTRNTKHTPKDGLCDVFVKAEDAPKIARVVDRFKFAAIDKEQSDIVEPMKQNPEMALTEKSRPSEPFSENKNSSTKGIFNKKPSVKKEIREIKTEKSKQKVGTKMKAVRNEAR